MLWSGHTTAMKDFVKILFSDKACCIACGATTCSAMYLLYLIFSTARQSYTKIGDGKNPFTSL